MVSYRQHKLKTSASLFSMVCALLAMGAYGGEVIRVVDAATPDYTSISSFSAAGGTLFYLKDRDIWKTDGHLGTAVCVATISDIENKWGLPAGHVSEFEANASLRNFVSVGSTLYFEVVYRVYIRTGYTGPVYGYYGAIWRTEGTLSSTSLVKSFPPLGTVSEFSSPLAPMTAVGDTLYFGGDFGSGAELARSDGTAGGTAMIKDLMPSPWAGYPLDFAEYKGNVYFTSCFTSGATDLGRVLMKTNGTSAGTLFVKDTDPTDSSGSGGLAIDLLRVVGDTLYFRAADPANSFQIWRSDGTPEGTALVRENDISRWASPEDLLEFKGMLFYTAKVDNNSHSRQIWRSDGTASGTYFLPVVNASNWPEAHARLGFGEYVYFWASDGVNGSQLWRTDGTPAGTSLFKVIRPGDTCDPTELVAYNGKFYFKSQHGHDYSALFRSDGTPEGTVEISAPNLDIDYYATFAEKTVIGDKLFFESNHHTLGDAVWAILPDADNNGIADIDEGDSDHDGLADYAEAQLGTDPLRPDTDGDGICDFDEVRDLDPLADGIQNPFDPLHVDVIGNHFDPVPDGIPDGRNDWDSDGMTDSEEFTWHTNPIDADSFVDLPIDSTWTCVVLQLALAMFGAVVLLTRWRGDWGGGVFVDCKQSANGANNQPLP